MKEKVKSILKEVFNQYHSQGITAIYLWGSITTEDYDPLTSDVDSIAIVEDTTDLTLEDRIKATLTNIHPEIRFGIRFLYKSELNGGSIKGFLASVIDPRALLLDLPHWELVSGTSYITSDFTLLLPTYQEVIDLHVKKFKDFGWLEVIKIPEGQHIHLMKTLARIIDYQQKDRENQEKAFSYSSLLEHTTKEEQRIVEIILANKKSHWDYSLFHKSVPMLQTYVNKLLTRVNY